MTLISKNRLAITMIAAIMFMTASTIESKAQSNWELGVRFGDDVAVDATIPLSTRPRLHMTGYFEDDFALGAYFDWLFAPAGGPQGLKLYPGVGPELFFGDDFDVAAAGNFGIEYSFNFPLTIGFDWRPRIMLSNDSGFYGGNWGFMARFRFGEGTHFKKVSQ